MGEWALLRSWMAAHRCVLLAGRQEHAAAHSPAPCPPFLAPSPHTCLCPALNAHPCFTPHAATPPMHACMPSTDLSTDAGYPNNPYHNATHAADVVRTTHVLAHAACLTAHHLDTLGLLALYFAAVRECRTSVRNYGRCC